MRKTTDTKIKLEHYERLINISTELVSFHDLSNLLNHILEAACELSESEGSSILLYSEQSRELYFQAAIGLEEPIMRGIVVPLDGSIAGWIAQNRTTVNIPDVHADHRHFGLVESISNITTRSLAGLPLISQDKVVGVMEVINKKGAAFTEYDLEVLDLLCTQAALAIENTRLFQQSDQIAELVHELRTPMSSISTAAYLLQQPKVLDEQRISLAKTVYTESQRLSELATSFLDLARLESGRASFKPTEFSLVELLQESLSVFEAKADQLNITTQLSTPIDLPKVVADRDKIKQVFLNFISNALKYNRQGGRLEVKVSATESEFSIQFIDNGIGMEPDTVRHLFEKFYRSSNTEYHITGTGLGLPICKNIIESHHGKIEISSVFGEGTTFTILLPRK